MALILSIHQGSQDSAAALFDDYKIIAAVQKERLSRVKKDGGLAPESVSEVLSIGGISGDRIETVVFSGSEFPGSSGKIDPGKAVDVTAILALYGLPKTVRQFFANHHLNHALPSLFFTDWDDALLYTADGAGDTVNYSHRVFKNGRLATPFGDDRRRHRPYRVDSLARVYTEVTEALGFRPLHHEGKVTGLAAFGKPTLKDDFARHFSVDADGLFSSDFTSGEHMRKTIMTLCEGHSREDAAASIQATVEDLMQLSVGRLLEAHKVRRLGLAGGLFSNVKLNQRLAENCGVDEVFVVPPMGDEGLVIGGALHYLLERDGLETWLKHRHRLADLYWGREFGAETGPRLLDYSSRIRRLPGAPAPTAARLLAEGKAVAIVNQRMEYGPRALGARSIMASPCRRDINDSLNRRLDRSDFMPFAPVIAEEDARTVFDITDVNAYAARFMTITCNVKPEWRERIPAVVHIDDTARPQIIRRAGNPLYYDTLAAFKAETGLPAVVNTSFNVHEEPIINTPEEAARALVDDRVDYLLAEDGVYGVAG